MNDNDDLLIAGDFNLPGLTWVLSDDDPSQYVPLSASSPSEILFTDNLSGCGIQQINGIRNFMGRQLDLIFSTDSNNCALVESNLVLSTIDVFHLPASYIFLREW